LFHEQPPADSPRWTCTRALGWQLADIELAVSRSVRWHLAHPPESPDADFTPDDRALAAR
jgi:hypothetical protein